MRKFLSKIYTGLEVFRVISKYEPIYLVWAIPQMIINAILPLLYIYFPKLIIEQLLYGNAYMNVAMIITIYVIIVLGINILNTYLANKCGICAEKFTYKLKNEIGLITMQLELADIESASNRDVISLANNAAGITAALTLSQNILSNLITIGGLSYIIVKLDLLFIILVVATLLIKTAFVKMQYSYRQKQRLKFAQNDRIGNYLTDISYFNIGGTKEIRLNNINKWFMGKISSWRNEMVSMQYKDYRIYTLLQISTAVITALQSLVILWILAERYFQALIDIADFTMYFYAATAIAVNLSRITEQIGDYNRQLLNVSDLNKLVSLKTRKNNDLRINEFSIPQTVEFVFTNVCFSYPGSDKETLKDVNITIQNKEKLVIVGLNGAGKTTFIKLLCKFYRPISGTITLNGIDIWNIPNEQYYRIIAAVFQDFSNLAFTISDNIAMGQNFVERDDMLMKMLLDSGLNDYINKLPNRYNTYITQQFNENGIELSGGQEQKIAIARALYKGSPVLILDEPTASLDPKAESEIYNSFFEAAKDKTTIFISHRLAASTLSDTIAVFSEGKIIEYGPHDELIRLNGLYAEMFESQRSSYEIEKIIF